MSKILKSSLSFTIVFFTYREENMPVNSVSFDLDGKEVGIERNKFLVFVDFKDSVVKEICSAWVG